MRGIVKLGDWQHGERFVHLSPSCWWQHTLSPRIGKMPPELSFTLYPLRVARETLGCWHLRDRGNHSRSPMGISHREKGRNLRQANRLLWTNKIKSVIEF